MNFLRGVWQRIGLLDLQAKIVLVLAAVIVPTFLLVTLIQTQLTRPILEEELRQLGVHAARSFSQDIVRLRWLQAPQPAPLIESAIQELVFSQPNLQRVDVTVRDPSTGNPVLLASNVEEDLSQPTLPFEITDQPVSRRVESAGTLESWEVFVPIVSNKRGVVGSVHVVVSSQLIARISQVFARSATVAAVVAMALMLVGLSYFLRRTVENDRLLRSAETRNLALTQQLHEAQRQLMTKEKLAVMGQLTASFAHEMGTPLNATGGHLQLLREELETKHPHENAMLERLSIIESQLNKIAQIVHAFLQSTAKPVSQRQLVDLNRLVERAIGLAQPQLDAHGIQTGRKLHPHLGPLRAVPIEIEQILLNLINNSVDSLRAKKDHLRRELQISTREVHKEGRSFVEMSVYDTGQGIAKDSLPLVLKPFFSTKRPGEGTGLGLTICQQTAKKYGGDLRIESREGGWTKVIVSLPFEDTESGKSS